MNNTTKRITPPTRFALLALGAIGFGCLTLPAMAGDDAPDGGAKNPSACRDTVNNKCLRKPRDDQSSQNQDTRNQDNAAAARLQNRVLANQPTSNDTNKYKYGRDDAVFGSGAGWTVTSRGNYEPWAPFPNKGGTTTTRGNGGNGGATGHKGTRHTLTTPNRTVQTATASPKAATPKSTTVDKATNTMTRDYRAGATAAPGGPPPAAAIGSSKPTAEQLAAQSGTRDHRHK
jgi:hypothetical protein